MLSSGHPVQDALARSAAFTRAPWLAAESLLDHVTVWRTLLRGTNRNLLSCWVCWAAGIAHGLAFDQLHLTLQIVEQAIRKHKPPLWPARNSQSSWGRERSSMWSRPNSEIAE